MFGRFHGTAANEQSRRCFGAFISARKIPFPGNGDRGGVGPPTGEPLIEFVDRAPTILKSRAPSGLSRATMCRPSYATKPRGTTDHIPWRPTRHCPANG